MDFSVNSLQGTSETCQNHAERSRHQSRAIPSVVV